ncbi:stage II sporulation protein R [Clostridium cellulovorans]|uniref:Stage II sporulation protein R n=1 Tax=Clostridium cellulovorans (strain ATCC 35296 / DSM 3052 / OCM 3 / 743B) TaxID=573061 RepID=D9STP5_CLOC7|nr:stage II sporulation protein R [Clostridium cellulovorans]ADL52779.1 stage II sporulation protein R [Clostridium cellulovorans 743B]
MKKLSVVIIILLIVFLAIPSNEEVQGIIDGRNVITQQVKDTSEIGVLNTKEQNENGQVMQEEIAKKLIRFHVIANSDSDDDQKLKLKVRDEVLKFIAPKLKESKSIDESRGLIMENDQNIKNIAKEIINKNGYNYSVKTTLGQCNFPVKEYGNIILPAGEYEAYRIVIGDGEGKNWWCVMFPPLCFVDITKGQVAYEETKEEMKTVLNDEEYSYIDKEKDSSNESLQSKEENNDSAQKEESAMEEDKNESGNNDEENKNDGEDTKIEVRFKVVDVIDDIFNK